MRFRLFFVQMGPGTRIDPSGTDGAKVLGHIGRAAARGERAAVHGGKHGGGGGKLQCAGANMGRSSRVFRVCTCLLVCSVDDVAYS